MSEYAPVTPEVINNLLSHGQNVEPVDENTTYIIDANGRVFMDSKVVLGAVTDFARDLTAQGMQAKYGQGRDDLGALYGACAKTMLSLHSALNQMEGIIADAHTAKMLDPDNQG